jgi:hypothetical protein
VLRREIVMKKNSQATSDSSPRRLNIVVPERTVERINRLKDVTLASSSTEVIKTAILAYEIFVEALAKGGKFYVSNPGENMLSPIVLMLDVPLKTPVAGGVSP